MPLGDAFQASTDKALEVLASRPIEPDPPAPKHSAWSVIPRALAAAGAEVGGNVMDIAGAYGQTMAATGAGANPMIPEDAATRKERLDVFDKLKTEGIDWRGEESQQAYSYARDLRPDPQTAGTAENIVFGLTKGLTKAIGGGALLGPVAGAATFGASEGMTTSEDLAVQGVDQATRTKVGAVTGAINAAGMAIPAAGQTLGQTAALVAVGGPGSFVAQQAASRALLENADYHEQAQQFDPLDPTGLALATLLPAGFAAWARAGRTAKPGAPSDPAAPAKVTQDEADAVMVHNLTAAADEAEANPPAKMAADAWRADVTQNDNFRAWFGDSKVVDSEGKPLVVYHGTTAEFDAFDVSKSSSEGTVGKAIYLTSDPSYSAEFALGAFGAKGPAAIVPVYVKASRVVDFGAQLTQDGLKELQSVGALGEKFSLDAPVTHGQIFEFLTSKFGSKEAAIEKYRQAGYDAIRFEKYGGKHDTIAVFDSSQVKSAIGNSGKFDPNSGSLTDRVEAQSMSLPDQPAKPMETAEQVADPRLEAIKSEQPDLTVKVSDDGTPIKLTDELEAAKKLAQEGTDDSLGINDAPLLKVAAECFLSLGATAG